MAHHHIPEEPSSNYTAMKTAQLACKYIYTHTQWVLIHIGVHIKKVGLYKNNIYEGIFPDKNVIQVFCYKSNMADFQYQPCITLDSAQSNREESKLMLITDAERHKK